MLQPHDCSGLIVAGLTGGIASGKSTVARMLAAAGARVVDADRIAHEVVQPGRRAWQAVRTRFGDGVVRPDGNLDREKLGRMVFRDPAIKRDLEQIVHPFVFRQMASELKSLAAARPGAVVVLDIPLLIESGLHRVLPLTALVHVPEAVQLARLIRRDGLAAADARARIRAQMPIDAKRAHADVIIDNAGPLEATRRQALTLYRRLRAKPPPPPRTEPDR
ncbi:MAG: dephospho-CoA kinase [Desulfobacterales bacterium]|nr:dephospho-CoA kinase [Desulfobacterales bacterium]